MDVVLVGLPGSGKTAVGRRLASRHGGDVRGPRRADRERGRADDPRDLRAGRRGRRSGAWSATRSLALGEPDAVRRGRARDLARRRRRSWTRATGGPCSTAGSRSGWTCARRCSPSACAARRRCDPSCRAATRSAGSAQLAVGARALLRGRRPGQRPVRGGQRRERGRAAGGAGGPARDHDPAARDDVDRRAGPGRRDRGATAVGRGAAAGWRRGARAGLGARARGPRSARASRSACATTAGRWTSLMLPGGEAAKRLAVIEEAAREPVAAAGRAGRAAGGRRRRRARRPGGVPRGDVPARGAVDRRADDARRAGRLVDRRQDRRRPAGGQEPRRARSTTRRRSCWTWPRSGRSRSASCGRRWARS